jgi:hypothetical protein
MTNEGACDEGQFLRRLQQLLTEGEFVSSYKFALLLSLVRWALEHADHDEAQSLRVLALAPHFLDLYWPHVEPFSSASHAPAIAAEPSIGYGDWAWHGVLVQDRGQQVPRVFKLIRTQRDQGCQRWQQLPPADRDQLLREVARLIQEMPLWKLHTLRDRDDPLRFLYRRGARSDELQFERGAIAFLVEFAPLIEDAVRAAWLRFVLRCNPRVLAAAANLDGFLFPSSRASLDVWRPVLRDLQHDDCFYCGERIGSDGAVDHFLPWSRYARDLGHNFVLAHGRCNAAKRDHLAATDHLARWCRRNREHGSVMAQRFAAANLPHDWPVLWQVARSLYRTASACDGRVWVEQTRLVVLSHEWQTILADCRPGA